MSASRSIADALDKITEIHGHMTRGEVYRGYRPLPVALTGVSGIAGALLQPLAVRPGDLEAFALYWLALAALNTALHAVVIVTRFLRDDPFARRRALRVLGQLVPSLAAGGLLTAGIAALGADALALLPGAWALLFALALFSSRPYLPRRVGWVALWHLAGGGILLLEPPGDASLMGWAMGAVFGAGLLGAAAVLHRDERRHG